VGEAKDISAVLNCGIIERILNVLAPKKLAPHKHIVPLLWLNKHWHAAACCQLYAAISLKGQWVACPLRKTLDKTPALATLVTELIVDTELSTQDPKETADHMCIVATCPHLQHLTVLGYAPVDVATYRHAIASCAALVTLNLSEGAGMFTFAQLLAMLPGWLQLKKLILKDTLLPADTDTPAPASAGAQCPVLKMVKIDTLDATQQFSFATFAALAHPCPSCGSSPSGRCPQI
jgi:hypothetical protein